MKLFLRAAFFLVALATPLFAGGEQLLEQTWQRYNELFRSPREIMFEVRTELKDPDQPLRLQQAADLLRSFPNVEEAFPILPCIPAEQETLVIFQMLNAPPAEFGAWIEKLQPRRVRQAIRKFVQEERSRRDPRDSCDEPDPLHLKKFYQLPGSTPFFKQPLPTGLYVRLKPDPSFFAGRAWTWKQQADRLEEEVRRFYEKSGWNPSIVRYQYVPPSKLEAGALLFPTVLLLTLFWGLTFYWRTREGETVPAAAGWPGFLARRRKSIMFLLLLGLVVPLALRKIQERNPGNPRRPVVERIGSLKSDHAWEERTACLLAEASGWGDIVYELGAQRFAFLKAKEDRLVTRHWSPIAWVPRSVFQRSNAADFLKKRNAVVLEKIARQEKLAPKDFAPTLEFLNRVGEASLPLTQDENAAWVLSREPNALGVRCRQWMRTTGPGPDSIAVLSYCFVAPPTSETALMPWISEAVRPFGVEARWVAPEILHQAAIRDMLLRMACVSAALLAAFFLLARGRRICLSQAALSTFFFLASWLLSLVALGWNWTGSSLGGTGSGLGGAGGGLWIWTSVAAWHSALCLEFFTRKKGAEADRAGVFAAAAIAGVTALATAWLWSLSGRSEGYASVLAMGYFWSLAWCLLLAPSRSSR